MVTWTPALALGIAELDAQHQELFRRADAFLEGLDASSASEIERLLAFLRDHAEMHFRAEEDWMTAAAYPDLEAHRAEHRRFVVELARYAGTSGARPADVATWLVRWLHGHVVGRDGAAARLVLRRELRPS